MSDDIYKSAYSYIDSCRFDEVRNMMFDIRTWKLKNEFRKDGNHSWYIIGTSFWKENKYADALRAYRKSYSYWKEDWQAMWAISNCYSELKKHKLAERFIRKSLFYRKEKALNFNLGNILLDQKKFEEAIIEYKKIDKKSSFYIQASNNIKLIKKLNKKQSSRS